MKKRSFVALVLLCALVFMSIGKVTPAKAEEENYIDFTAGTSKIVQMTAGSVQHFKLPIRLTSASLVINTPITATVETESGLFDPIEAVLSNDKEEDSTVIKPEYGKRSVKTYVEFDLSISDLAKIGTYDAVIRFKYSGFSYAALDGGNIKGSQLPFKIRIVGEKTKVQLTVPQFDYNQSEAAVGAVFDLTLSTQNIGEIKAFNTYLTIDFGDSGIVPNYSATTFALGDFAQDDIFTQTLSLNVLPTASTGLKTITMKYNYKDEVGNEYTASVQKYIQISAVSDVSSEDAKLSAKIKKNNEEVKVDTSYVLELELENIGKRPAKNIVITIPEDCGVGISTGILPEYPATGIEVENIAGGDKATVRIPLSITKSASTGLRELNIRVSYEDSKRTALTCVVRAYLTILEQAQKPEVKNELTISNIRQSPANPVSGENVTIAFRIQNSGNADITGLELQGDNLSSTGFEPLSANTKYSVGDLKKGEYCDVELEFKVGSGITAGMNELSIAASYKDINENQQKEINKIYILNVQKQEEVELKNSVSISGISQSPAKPVMGENVTVSFRVENNGTKEITDVKVAGANLGSSGFEPVSSEVYTKVGKIEAGASKQVSMTFKLGESIAEGFNTLSLECLYRDANGNQQTEQTALYVLNVQKQGASANSRPKIIVDSFSCSAQELRAGSSFDFTFSLRNTNAVKAVKNMTVTVYQAQDVFTVTQGSNSFYVAEIPAGESIEKTINLKVKSDTATGAYDLTIKIAYEYDEMSQADLTTGGVNEELPIKLQAVENARPALQNLSIGYDWDTPTVNQSTTLMFEFYNMGKSTLNNVYVTLDSESLRFETGTTAIIGSVAAGMNSFQEISVLPLMEGMAAGNIIVHFEDSNGDEVTKEFELPSTYIQGEVNYDWNDPGMNWEFPTDGDNLAVAKEPLMPVWAYIVSLVGAALAGTLVTRGIMITVYKKKHRAEAED